MVSRLSLFAKCRVVSTPVKITVSVLLVIVASAYAEKRGADERTRTADLLITNVLLTREGAAADASLLVLSTVFLCGDLSLFSVRAARNLS